MKQRLGGALMCLVFAIPFGGVGVFASWVIVGSILDAQRAKEWVRVKADVVSYSGGEVVYRYRVGEREFNGTRLNPSVIGAGGSDNVDDEIDGWLSSALSEKKPITVFVDPADPNRSMVDREMPWKMTLFFIPFALAFGGVGVGALYMLFRILSGADERKKKSGQRTSDGLAGVMGIWIFAFFWNAISIPIALIALPQMWAEGEWWGLLILLFPLIGVLMIWGAISQTWNQLRRGGARLNLATDHPRAGSPLQGFVSFPRGVKSGENFRARLVCNRVTDDGDGGSKVDVHWFREQTLRTSDSGGGVRLALRFEVPSEVPGTRPSSKKDKREFRWRIEASPTDRKGAPEYGFDFDLDSAPAGLVSETPAADTAADPDEPQMAAAIGPELVPIRKMMEERGVKMTTAQQAELAKLSQGQREAVVNVLRFAPKAKKILIWVVVAFIAFQFLGGIVAVIAAISGALS